MEDILEGLQSKYTIICNTSKAPVQKVETDYV